MSDDISGAYLERVQRREDAWSPAAMALKPQQKEVTEIPESLLFQLVSKPEDVPIREIMEAEAGITRLPEEDTLAEKLGQGVKDITRPVMENPAGRAIVGGVRDAVQGSADMLADIASSKAGLELKAPQLPDMETKGTPEAMMRGLVHFMSVFAASGGMGAGKLGSIGAGAIADATFDPEEGNLASFLRELDIDNEVTQFLDSKTRAEAKAAERLKARLKQSLEGAGLGFALDGVMSGFKWAKKHRANDIRKMVAK